MIIKCLLWSSVIMYVFLYTISKCLFPWTYGDRIPRSMGSQSICSGRAEHHWMAIGWKGEPLFVTRMTWPHTVAHVLSNQLAGVVPWSLFRGLLAVGICPRVDIPVSVFLVASTRHSVGAPQGKTYVQ